MTDGRKAYVHVRVGLAWPAMCEAAVCKSARDRLLAQRHSVGVGCPAGLVLVDLPVDLVIVLEHQERAGQPQGTERALRERCDERR